MSSATKKCPTLSQTFEPEPDCGRQDSTARFTRVSENDDETSAANSRLVSQGLCRWESLQE